METKEGEREENGWKERLIEKDGGTEEGECFMASSVSNWGHLELLKLYFLKIRK